MNREASRWWLCVALVVCAAVAGCGPEDELGIAQVVGTLPQSLSASDVARVELTVSGAGMASRTDTLVKTGGRWGGVLGNLPAGTGRVFSAQAFDASSKLLYKGQVAGVTITAGKTTTVALLLQQVDAPTPFENAAPVITSLVASPGTVGPAGMVALKATAEDANVGDTLTYEWTGAAGSFSSATSLSTTWMAPATPGPVVLTLKVMDSKGAVAALSVTITVSTGVGSAAVDVSVNTWPQVVRVTATPTAVEVGSATTVVANASDNDGDSLSYQWATTCKGTWANATSASASFTPSAEPPAGSPCASCALTVTVSDGRGGQTTGTLSVCVGPKPTARFPPEVVESFQSSSNMPTAGGTVTFRVKARDEQGSALSFAWAASTGSLGTATSGATTSEVLWTAPACVPGGSTATVTVTVTSALGLSTSASFALAGGTACTPSTTVTNWALYDFALPAGLPASACQGTHYVGYSKGYGKWVGAALCGTDSTAYKLFLSTSPYGPFYEITDTAGHGQDHCELVNPSFTLPNEDDITSGGCTTCADTGFDNATAGRTVFWRSLFGQPFSGPVTASPGYNTSSRYQCGVSIASRSAVTSWSRYDFAFPPGLPAGACQGARYVGYSDGYQMWVGIALCGTDKSKYKIFLSKSQMGPYYEIVDTSGGGEDNCELLTGQGTLTGGGCTSCALGPTAPAYDRTVFVRSFHAEEFYGPYTATSAAEDTPEWYKCGVSMP